MADVLSPPLIRRATSPTHETPRLSSPSLVSSPATSFRTAPLAGSQPASSSSSVATLGPLPSARDADNINPIHAMAGAQEIHILKVTRDVVHVEAGPIQDTTFLHKVAHSLTFSSGPDDHVGPPPPSPPASVEREEDDFISPPPSASMERADDGLLMPPPPRLSKPSVSEPGPRPLTFEEPLRERQSEPHASTSASAPHGLSASMRMRRSNTSDETPFPRAGHLSTDGYLHPPPVTMHRPTRRNTTGSSPKPLPQPFTLEDGSGELASDIQLHAERIRRERMSKRAKHEAEAALTRTETREAQNPLVGNLIGEDHVNYVLMYNMLTGIRIGVSRCQAKIKRPLTDDDFKARHKFSFDVVGNELTPSAKYDFKFKDYAPWVFRELREDHFQLDPADYLLSLTAKYILSELGSPGKSGSFFYFSCDYRFIIKTIRHAEHKFLLSVLKQYHAHVKANPHTLLSRFYGLHRVKLPHGRKIHFVIMNNLFPPHRDIHETYDLKGSTVGREYPEERAAKNPRAVLKDLNWINRGNMLELGPEKRALLTEQLKRDAELLRRIRVMDYSLLVGIHDVRRGNKDNVRRNTLKVFAPDIPPMRRQPTQLKHPEAMAVRRGLRESDPKRLGNDTIRLPEEDTGDRQQFVFYQDEGGLRATDEANEPMNVIYYLGVIDILTPYGVAKKIEHLWKGMQSDIHKISPVPPNEYADRFFSFMKAIMRGGGGGAKFKSE